MSYIQEQGDIIWLSFDPTPFLARKRTFFIAE